jgi:hypothetical protein
VYARLSRSRKYIFINSKKRERLSAAPLFHRSLRALASRQSQTMRSPRFARDDEPSTCHRRVPDPRFG